MSTPGTLYLLPNTLGKTSGNATHPEEVLEIIRSLDMLIVENIQNATRFLQWVGNTIPEFKIEFYPINKKTSDIDLLEYIKPVKKGRDAGVLSEVGLPTIADPGARLVQLAHKYHIPVRPLVGPSSIFLALMSSGFNGQQFQFHGYLPLDDKACSKKIQELEGQSKQHDISQIFMETPYRNTAIIKRILSQCNDFTRLCIACDISLETEEIISKPIGEWKKMQKHTDNDLIKWNKRPVIYLLYAH
tara:strand:+ start:97 stop:831 length:735 start_codon:yes stop_codon:yes gene_type:complete